MDSKCETLLEIQELLEVIAEKMSALKEELDAAASCVQEKKILGEDTADRTIEGLKEIRSLSNKFRKLYEQTDLAETYPEDVEAGRRIIAQAISDYKLNQRLSKYKRFLSLQTDDSETEKLLNAQKARLQVILEQYTPEKDQDLEPYHRFVETMSETDSTKLVDAIVELSEVFEHELLGKAVLLKLVFMPGEAAAKPAIWAEKQEEAEDESTVSGTFGMEAIFSEGFYSHISEGEGKKIGTKIFMNDMKAKHILSNIVAMKCMDKYEVVTMKAAAAVSGVPLEELELSFEYLQRKGYVREYGVPNVGSFLCISPKGNKVLQAKDARGFLKIKGKYQKEAARGIEQTLAQILARVAYAKLLEIYFEQLKDYSKNPLHMVWQECFSMKLTKTESSESYVFTGAFWDHGQEREEYVKCLKDSYTEEYVNFVIAGPNQESTKKLAGELAANLQLNTGKVYLYALLENVLTVYDSGEKISFEALLEDAEELEEDAEEAAGDVKEPSENAEEATEYAEKTAENAEESARDVKEPSENAEEATEYAKEPSEDAEEATEYAKEPSEDAEEATEYAKEPSEDAEEATKDAKEPSEGAEEPTKDAKESSESAEKQTKDAKESSENAEKPTKDAEKSASIAELERKDNTVCGQQIIIPFDITPAVQSYEAAPMEPSSVLDMEHIMANVFQMIADEKIYCATTYLRALAEDVEGSKEVYDKLAYAVNAPWMRCSYNSQKIFTLYSSGVDEFTKYLMIAATLRNFFLNHVSYDYTMKALHANVKELPVVNSSSSFTNLVYQLAVFKDQFHKGIDYYADYRVKEQVAVERDLDALVMEAKSYYESYVSGHIKETASHKRFLETRKKIFAQDGDLAGYLRAVTEKDFELADFAREYLQEIFMGDGCSVEYTNIDSVKLNAFIDEYWDRAGEDMRVARKTSDLMSRLRNNLLNAIEKVLHVICDWIALVEKTSALGEDDGTRRYKEIKKDLLAEMETARSELQAKRITLGAEESAGCIVVEHTLQELMARLDGSYNEKSHKYFYIDFLRGNKVLLDHAYFPDMRGKFGDFRELSLPNRILQHSKSKLLSFEEKLDEIFNQYGDDYGTAELIVNYLEDMGDTSCSDRYNIRKSQEIAEIEAKLKLDDFIENLELAQSYGQIEETKENKKEKIQKVANEWFAYAKETQNYGFFHMVLDQYRKKLHEDAKVRGRALLQELDAIKAKGAVEAGKLQKIQQMIDNQNYTVAEDLLSRIHKDEVDEGMDAAGIDYLEKFIRDYDYNYNIVADSSLKLSDLVFRIHNKDDRGARRLVDNWMNNGQSMGTRKLNTLLDALGFAEAEVKEQPKIGKVENYSVKIKPAVGRKVNYKHPIAAFGSKASNDGFRVVCLFGRYDADRLIEEFKNIAGTKNTLVLLDYALSLSDRRRLARKSKSDLTDKAFAVLDRVLLMFLINNYSVQFINQILMSVMMPFSYYQPYVWDSSMVMPPEIFMGRKEQLEKIESPAGVNIVYGGRQLGKSALLKMAKMDIDGDENNDRAVLVEIKKLDYQRAAKKIGHELFDAGVLAEDISTTDWDELARAIKRRLQDSHLPRIPYLLLLLDEADTFIESCEAVNFQPFDALKDIQSVGTDRFKFVIAGLHNIVRFKRDAALSDNSVLTHLTSITVKPFAQREARLLLEEPLYYLGFRFPEDKQSLVSLILANTNYFPGLIQLYCANLIEAMRKSDYAGYDQIDTPTYEIRENHIKKVLSDPDFMEQIHQKFDVTLKLGEDNMYYIIALLMAYLYHQNTNSASESQGFSAKDIICAGEEYGVKKIADLSENVVNGLMQELVELNILRQTVNELYLFSRYSFFQMMGTASEVDDKLFEYMED